MLVVTGSNKTDILAAGNPPAAACSSGESVVFETQDCFDGSVSREGKRTCTDYMHNPATGPLYVNGAEPGDTLKVEILSIALNSWGAMGTYFGEGAFSDMANGNTMHAYDLGAGSINVGGHALPLDPMVGVIGVAPAGEGVLTVTPGDHGGNMDCSRVRTGAALYFPVSCPGALLSMGDLHALMGDGEVFGYGLEAAGKVTVRVSVVKDYPVPCPVIAEGGDVMAVASAPTLEQASNRAVRAMHGLLARRGLSDTEAGLLLSLKCNLKICQIVNPLFTVRAELPGEFIRLP